MEESLVLRRGVGVSGEPEPLLFVPALVVLEGIVGGIFFSATSACCFINSLAFFRFLNAANFCRFILAASFLFSASHFFWATLLPRG